MNKSTVVKAQNISKVYKLYNKPFDRVKEALNPFKKSYHKDFHALHDVSFELKRGEALGIIGRNGNGKSTLLKIIAGVLTPTKGHVNTKGRIAAILELTSSLKPELTGLENIELNLKINGFNKEALKEKIKEIEEFAEIGEFIDQPVKTYSSGMKSRLGFGIATSSEPDVLILDEVLAVGDFNFQQKCLAKINSMRERISMIFVSHSMNSVRLFCDNVMVLEKGKNTFYGKADDGIKYYLEQEEKKKQELKKKEKKQEIKPFYGDLFHNEDKIVNVKHKWNKESYKLEEEMVLEFSFELKYKPKNLIIGIPVWNDNGDFITAFNTDYYNINLFENIYKIQGVLVFDCFFNPNIYYSVIAIVDGSEYLYRQLNNKFYVKNKERVFGFVTIKHEWRLND
ncbi:ABC transporter ATP-binding protein [Sulfurimonas sp.]|uniref:ABC transporter ATP-binding protein n=1 Tax=Sulfurimonas sp. TaxID=2022749 RepID=UPI0026233003|nr:ABC transporter ATP-binding protein [Sulfurimonas sp.]